MKRITYVTGNYGKYISVKKYFENQNIRIDFYKNDLKELDINDIQIISRQKALDAYNILKQPCFVSDTGFYIENYPNNPGYPGAFVKRSGISSNIDKLLMTMKNETNRNCKFIDCLTFYDGNEFYTFYGISEGTLAYEKRGEEKENAKSNLWNVFIPKNCGKTLSEMTEEEIKNRNDGHTSATENFIEWYKNNYMNPKVLKKDINIIKMEV